MIHSTYPTEPLWIIENLPSFNEAILSWNASRPAEGRFLFYLSAKIEEKWSPWLLYAVWGSKEQSSFLSTTAEAAIRVYQDSLELREGKKAAGCQIKIVTEGKADLAAIRGLHLYTNGGQPNKFPAFAYPRSIALDVRGLSQMSLDHQRRADLCSPTSTTAVVSYLLNDVAINPIHFAHQVWDSGFDIFGNWVFNVAQASHVLGPAWECWVERLRGFDAVYQFLESGTPVIVSVRGPLIGSAKPYAKGHLMSVIGYDALGQQVKCMDPGFPEDEKTHVFYPLPDFLQAWQRRGNIAYVFKPVIKPSLF